MSLIQTNLETEYPETDGKPMGETDVHRWWMAWIFDVLSHRYRGEQVYVSCNLLLYYSEGNPHEFVVPDDFVVKECDPGPRRTFKTWEEGKAPNMAFEVTSRGTRRDDQVYKPQVYAKIGVKELFLYDPTAEYLTPPLQGFRLTDAGQVEIEPDESGSLQSAELEMKLCLEEGQLVMYDSHSGQRLLTEAETERERAAEAEERAAEERERADAERAAREAAEEELRQLRQQLGDGGKDASD